MTSAEHPQTAAFAAGVRFTLDDFQVAGCHALEDGHSALVAAPTGAGKTVIGEFAIYRAMQSPADKAFYTTPMKALSNQKFRELTEVYGADQVGLLTGDTNINSSARIVVMTTEVLRNMLYADSLALRDLRYVIMDEVHYLADRFRGPVWEEVILHLPAEVRLVALSATVSNAEEFGDWLATARGNTAVIVSEVRPVPLEQHLLVRGDLLPLFDDEPGSAQRVNPDLRRLGSFAREGGGRGAGGHSRGSRRHRRHPAPPQRAKSMRMNRPEAVELLHRDQLLPAIFFIFSRAGCDGAVQQVLRSGVRLTDRAERDEIRAIIHARTRSLPDEDLAALGFWEWRESLERGVAAHHAGLIPAFKEVVEELFQRKLVKAVFATETLALGINMPARTVVLEKLEKFNGEARVPITSGEYTQLTGRAGRRGIDTQGHSVIHWSEGVDVEQVAALASRRMYPLVSSFRPTYNMAVNLLDQVGRPRAREILESSFAQFQADRAVVGLAQKVRSADESLAGYAESMTCERGDFIGYSSIRRELSDLEKINRKDVTAGRSLRDKRKRHIAELRTRMQRHSCHECPDREDHARWAERYWRLRRDTDRLRKQISQRTGNVARVFDRVVDVLTERDYVRVDESGETVLTDPGQMLRRIYGERDLLVAQCLREGVWDDLDAASLAAMATCLVYEPRREESDTDAKALPRGAFRAAFERTHELWFELDEQERQHRLPGSNPISPGIASAMHLWARGKMLDHVLLDADLAAGDFVRWTKQTIDLLDQLSLVAPSPLAATARSSLEALRRGIVAYSAVA